MNDTVTGTETTTDTTTVPADTVVAAVDNTTSDFRTAAENNFSYDPSRSGEAVFDVIDTRNGTIRSRTTVYYNPRDNTRGALQVLNNESRDINNNLTYNPTSGYIGDYEDDVSFNTREQKANFLTQVLISRSLWLGSNMNDMLWDISNSSFNDFANELTFPVNDTEGNVLVNDRAHFDALVMLTAIYADRGDLNENQISTLNSVINGNASPEQVQSAALALALNSNLGRSNDYQDRKNPAVRAMIFQITDEAVRAETIIAIAVLNGTTGATALNEYDISNIRNDIFGGQNVSVELPRVSLGDAYAILHAPSTVGVGEDAGYNTHIAWEYFQSVLDTGGDGTVSEDELNAYLTDTRNLDAEDIDALILTGTATPQQIIANSNARRAIGDTSQGISGFISEHEIDLDNATITAMVEDGSIDGLLLKTLVDENSLTLDDYVNAVIATNNVDTMTKAIAAIKESGLEYADVAFTQPDSAFVKILKGTFPQPERLAVYTNNVAEEEAPESITDLTDDEKLYLISGIKDGSIEVDNELAQLFIDNGIAHHISEDLMAGLSTEITSSIDEARRANEALGAIRNIADAARQSMEAADSFFAGEGGLIGIIFGLIDGLLGTNLAENYLKGQEVPAMERWAGADFPAGATREDIIAGAIMGKGTLNNGIGSNPTFNQDIIGMIRGGATISLTKEATEASQDEGQQGGLLGGLLNGGAPFTGNVVVEVTLNGRTERITLTPDDFRAANEAGLITGRSALTSNSVGAGDVVSNTIGVSPSELTSNTIDELRNRDILRSSGDVSYFVVTSGTDGTRKILDGDMPEFNYAGFDVSDYIGKVAEAINKGPNNNGEYTITGLPVIGTFTGTASEIRDTLQNFGVETSLTDNEQRIEMIRLSKDGIYYELYASAITNISSLSDLPQIEFSLARDGVRTPSFVGLEQVDGVIVREVRGR